MIHLYTVAICLLIAELFFHGNGVCVVISSRRLITNAYYLLEYLPELCYTRPSHVIQFCFVFFHIFLLFFWFSVYNLLNVHCAPIIYSLAIAKWNFYLLFNLKIIYVYLPLFAGPRKKKWIRQNASRNTDINRLSFSLLMLSAWTDDKNAIS